MQKFVTLHLHSWAYNEGLFKGAKDAHGLVEEHLQDELADGWRITHVTGIGGASEGQIHAGWFGIVLERPDR